MLRHGFHGFPGSLWRGPAGGADGLGYERKPDGSHDNALTRNQRGATVDLTSRSFLTLEDFSADDIKGLLELSRRLKADKLAGVEQQRLSGKNIALIFEKTSTRTRCAFEVAAYDQGAHATYLGPSGSQIGHKETMKDTARVLGRMYDAIEYRGFSQGLVETLAEYAGVPVYNGLTDEYHPTQILADVMTMIEHCDKPLGEISYCYLGDARNNMGNSLLVGGTKLGMDVRLAAPEELWPAADLRHRCDGYAAESGGRVMVTADARAAVAGVDFLYTDVWVSMGEDASVWEKRIELLRPYQINSELIAATVSPDVKFLHCLPAFHNRDTKVGAEVFEKFGLDGIEVTEEVFESEHSVVFDQAENRLHTIKAVMVATLAG